MIFSKQNYCGKGTLSHFSPFLSIQSFAIHSHGSSINLGHHTLHKRQIPKGGGIGINATHTNNGLQKHINVSTKPLDLWTQYPNFQNRQYRYINIYVVKPYNGHGALSCTFPIMMPTGFKKASTGIFPNTLHNIFNTQSHCTSFLDNAKNIM